MTSNNLEAIELLKKLKDSIYITTDKDLDEVIELLQADEDIEVQTVKATEMFDVSQNTVKEMVKKFPKPTKETKLRELRNNIKYSDYIYRSDFQKLIEILLEEEY